MTIVEKVKNIKPADTARQVVLAAVGGAATVFEAARDGFDTVIEKREGVVTDLAEKGADVEVAARKQFGEARSNVKSFAEARAEKIRSLLPAIPGVNSKEEHSEEEKRIIAMEKKLVSLTRKVNALAKKLDTKAAPKKPAAKKTVRKAAAKKAAPKKAAPKKAEATETKTAA